MLALRNSPSAPLPRGLDPLGVGAAWTRGALVIVDEVPAAKLTAAIDTLAAAGKLPTFPTEYGTQSDYALVAPEAAA